VAKWTKATVGQHITVGGLGATSVGTAAQVADNMERWVEEADVDGFNLVRSGSVGQMVVLWLTFKGICCQARLIQGHHRPFDSRVAPTWPLLGRLCRAQGNIP
jgi:hypothetical protein